MPPSASRGALGWQLSAATACPQLDVQTPPSRRASASWRSLAAHAAGSNTFCDRLPRRTHQPTLSRWHGSVRGNAHESSGGAGEAGRQAEEMALSSVAFVAFVASVASVRALGLTRRLIVDGMRVDGRVRVLLPNLRTEHRRSRGRRPGIAPLSLRTWRRARRPVQSWCAVCRCVVR
jgi:hypothetical protein